MNMLRGQMDRFYFLHFSYLCLIFPEKRHFLTLKKQSFIVLLLTSHSVQACIMSCAIKDQLPIGQNHNKHIFSPCWDSLYNEVWHLILRIRLHILMDILPWASSIVSVNDCLIVKKSWKNLNQGILQQCILLSKVNFKCCSPF